MIKITGASGVSTDINSGVFSLSNDHIDDYVITQSSLVFRCKVLLFLQISEAIRQYLDIPLIPEMTYPTNGAFAGLFVGGVQVLLLLFHVCSLITLMIVLYDGVVSKGFVVVCVILLPLLLVFVHCCIVVLLWHCYCWQRMMLCLWCSWFLFLVHVCVCSGFVCR